MLDGVLDMQIGENAFTATHGWFGIGPRNIPHRFNATETGPATTLMIVTPAGFERFFDELRAIGESPIDFDKLKALIREVWHADYRAGVAKAVGPEIVLDWSRSQAPALELKP